MPPPQTQLPAYHWRTIHPNAVLHYARDLTVADALLDDLRGSVGFDLEWKPTFTKNTPENPVAIVQLANESMILVIQVSAMTNDAKKLYKDWQVSAHNCVDLSLLARCVDNAQWKGKYSAPLGLARLVEAYESRTLPKGTISRNAANDAHAGFMIYQRLSAMAHSMSKVPKPVYYSFSIVQGFLCEPSGIHAHWNYHNPDYDPGPPPPPKPPKPPTARDIRKANARAATRLGGTAGAISESGSAPKASQPSTTNARSNQIDSLRRSIQRRADLLSDSNSRDATSSSSMSSSLPLVQPSHLTSAGPPSRQQRRQTSQNDKSVAALVPKRRRRRSKKTQNPVPVG
ncbi:hypothetical protein C0995_001700 [Termitomyces sp. Mi166|nr:hypothetical protein C0995_001700 [Termitomyces sp. Mi166\